MEVDFSAVLFFSALGFSLAAPLGPVNLEMIKVSLRGRNGFIMGVVTGLGASFGDFVIAMTVLFLGETFLSQFLEFPLLVGVLLFANAMLLGYLGTSALMHHSEVDIDESGYETSVLRQSSVGFLFVITSPWSYLWWVSFGPTIVASNYPLSTVVERATITFLFLLGIWAWVIVLNVGLHASQNFASEGFLNFITNVSAVLILVFAVSIFADAIWYMMFGDAFDLFERIIKLFGALFS